MSAIYIVLEPRGRQDVAHNSWTISYISLLMMFQAFLTNLKLNPSGPGALSESHEAIASSISSLVNGSVRKLACAWDMWLKSRLSKVGLIGNSYLKIFLKNFDASSFIWAGSLTVSPPISMLAIEFFLFLLDATSWKNLVFGLPHWAIRLETFGPNTTFSFYPTSTSQFGPFSEALIHSDWDLFDCLGYQSVGLSLLAIWCLSQYYRTHYDSTFLGSL